METRKLGRQGLEVSAIGLGCMGMSGIYATGADPAECEATLLAAVDAGVTLFDTAEVYGPYRNEELLGRVLGAHRDRLVLATKFGFDLSEGFGKGRVLDSRPDHVRSVVEQSLRRLRTDRIDLLYQHRVDPRVPIEDVVGAMAELVRAGKVRYLGLSEASGADLPPEDYRASQPRFQDGSLTANARLLEKLAEVAARARATPAQVALAWLLAQGEDIVPIFGTTRRPRLRENLGAIAVRLAACDQFLLDQVFAPGSVAGERYLAAGMAMIDREP